MKRCYPEIVERDLRKYGKKFKDKRLYEVPKAWMDGLKRDDILVVEGFMKMIEPEIMKKIILFAIRSGIDLETGDFRKVKITK